MKYTEYINELLIPFKEIIGNDFNKYSNHVHRVFLNCLLLDPSPGNSEKYAVASVFHDIGIWTNHTFDYLGPSIGQASYYLQVTGKTEWITEISEMIYWHHKISPYSGKFSTTENFRKADWIDVSLGVLKFGCDRNQLKSNRALYPNSGFHLFLVSKSLANLWRHPLNPLPMFKS